MVELPCTFCRGTELSMIFGLAKKDKSAGREMLPSLKARLACRAGMASSTAGIANGYVQGNLAILPEKLAASFHRFCQLNPKPCPVIGINDISKPDYGDPVPVEADEIPVFWACGVTPQSVIAAAKLPFAITHAPGLMLVTDLKNKQLAVL